MNQENQPKKNAEFGQQVLDSISEQHIEEEISKMIRFLKEIRK